MESTGFPCLICRQKKRKLEGGIQTLWIESTIITVCQGFCCLLFAFLMEKLLSWGGEGRAPIYGPACIFRAQKAGNELDDVSQHMVPSDLPWPPIWILSPPKRSVHPICSSPCPPSCLPTSEQSQ